MSDETVAVEFAADGYNSELAEDPRLCLILVVPLCRPFRDLKKIAMPVIASSLLVLLLAAASLSASGSLHRLLHRISGSSDQECLVCQFAHGQVYAGAIPPSVTISRTDAFAVSIPPQVEPVSRFDRRLSPSRAPPSDLPCFSA